VSTLGKIITFILLVCSVAFTMTAYVLVNETENWQEKYKQRDKELTDQINKLTETNETLKADLAKSQEEWKKWQKEILDHKTTIGLRDTKIADLEGQLAELKTRNKRLDDDIAGIKNQLQKQLDENAQLTKDKEAARTAMNDAIKAKREALDKLAAAEDEIANLRNQLQLTRGDLRTAIDLTKGYEETFGPEGRRLAEEGAKTPVPLISGQVKRADNRAGIVLISVGSDDGVKVDMNFEVVRPGARAYVGRVRVTNIYDEEAICRVILPMTPNPIKEGDYVTTRLQ